MFNLILFGGGLGAGKDTMRELLIETLGIDKEYHFSFALPLKDEANRFIESVKEGKSDEDIANEFGISIEDAKESIKILGETPKSYPEINSRSRTPEIRRFLQYWGTDVRRKQNLNYWVDIAEKMIKEKLNAGYTVIVTDGRFNNEYDLVNKLGGYTVCLNVSEDERCKRVLERDGIIPSKDALNHASEKDWRTYDNFTYKISSDNLTPEETANQIIKQLSL